VRRFVCLLLGGSSLKCLTSEVLRNEEFMDCSVWR
jgi:hypothetical protein